MNTATKTDSVDPRSSAWLSCGLEELASNASKPPRFDVVIVGSGYGGAIAAAELAGCREAGPEPIDVCVLERGNEYLQGMFPANMAELPGHVRFNTYGSAKPRGVREGLFDVRVGQDVSALVANGLGGGSLINAGVMERPRDEMLNRLPQAVARDLKQGSYYQRAKQMLGALDDGRENTVALHRKKEPSKYRALQRFGEDMTAAPSPGLHHASVTIAMRDKQNAFGVPLKECTYCGDCATGCNDGAKESLDLNLLVQARRRGAQIYTGATVLRIEPKDGLWKLMVVHTDDKLRKRQGEPLEIVTRRLILAAGSFGSTEILLRSRSETLKFSRLGHRFSTNGDMLAVAYKQDQVVDAVGDSNEPMDECEIGPTISGVLDLRDARVPLVVEELGIPGPLRRAFEEVVATTNALHDLAVSDRSDHGAPLPHDPCAIDTDAIERSLPLAVMGDDGADGLLELVEGETGKDDLERGDGAIRVRWPEVRDLGLFREQIKVLRARRGPSAPDARILPHPLWQLVPDDMQFLLDDKHGALFTVHPLGGCPMGADASAGTVDDLGRVFDPATGQPHAGLVVLDGSIVPGALGTNPALTIAALALRAVEKLRDDWGFAPWQGSETVLPERLPFRDVTEQHEASAQRETEIELVERLSGPVSLRTKSGDANADYVIEQTLRFVPASLSKLFLPGPDGTLPLQRCLTVKSGTLRIFPADKWREWHSYGEPEFWHDDNDGEKRVADILAFQADVSGTLKLLHREPSSALVRRLRALRAWLPNRGLRDTWQWIASGLRKQGGHDLLGMIKDGWKRAVQAWALASRAGEVRLVEYSLKVGEIEFRNPAASCLQDILPDSEIRGIKRLTYGRRSNPWRQLMEMSLAGFPVEIAPGSRPVLKLDPTYLVKERVPLVRVVEQRNQVAALADLASTVAYFARLLLTIHVWSFRKPDAPDARYEPRRLPGRVEGLPEPQVVELPMPRLPRLDKEAVVRLTRYAPGATDRPPVVLIHGYSASGTTFAHPAVRPNLATHLCGKGRDVWIVDLRTSCGMPTARDPWYFEEAALNDLPAAFEYVRRETGYGEIDVFAHCMGAAMFTMAVLALPEPGDSFFRARSELPDWIRKAVMSQIGPTVVMSPANLFRGYVMSYLRYFLPLGDYQFRVTGKPGIKDQLIDRLLATLPYPEEEFDVENPVWPCRRTAFVGTRHRMDALYGRDFNLANPDGSPRLAQETLEYIDDLFGPLSIDTVSQAIHFARTNMITNYAGRNIYVLRGNLNMRWKFPTMSIHGKENGLADIATLTRLKSLFAGLNFQTEAFEGFGHQDSLIGTDAAQVFEKVSDFLK